MAQGIGHEETIYGRRFNAAEERVRQRSWQVLADVFFRRYIQPTDVVVDVGAGDGLLLKSLQARRRIAVDISAHVLALREHGIEVVQQSATDFHKHLEEPADVMILSNFLEHLPLKSLVLDVFQEGKRVLRPGGRLLILQPNIRYTGPAYWDYIDHHIALTEHSLAEALDVCGYQIRTLIPRFLPYTAKSSLGALSARLDPGLMMRLYLAFPPIWRLLGAQTFIEAVA